MIPLPSGKFILRLSRIPVLLVLLAIILSCAGDYGDSDSQMSLFSPEVMGKTRFQPFFFTLDQPHYDYEDDGHLYNEQEANTKDWLIYFKNKTGEASVFALVYQTDLNKCKSLKDVAVDTNGAAKLLVQNNDLEAFRYLQFAKTCEPFLSQHSIDEYDYWEPVPLKDSAEKVALMIEVLKILPSVKSEFIKLRYAYQLVRLACYNRNYKDCIIYYDKYVWPNKSSSLIKNWALCIKARAAYKCGAPEFAKYCYAMVFDRCHSRRHLAKQGFFWASEFATTENTLYRDSLTAVQLCVTSAERIPVYALTAMQAVQDNSNLLDSIYRIQPQSEMLEWLLVRGVNQTEFDVLPTRSGYYSFGSYSESREGAASVNLNFLAFVSSVAAKGDARQPYLWSLCAAYLNCLTERYDDAKSFLSKVNLPNDTLVMQQKKLIEVLIRIKEIKPGQLNAAKETELANDFKILNYDLDKVKWFDARSYLLLMLAEKYKMIDDPLKATLCEAAARNDVDVRNEPRNKPLDGLIAFAEKQNKTPFEQLIANSSATDLNTLYEVKGTVLLTQHNYAEALKAFAKTNMHGHGLADPFMIHIKDCHDCDYELADSIAAHFSVRITMSKADLAQRLLQLEQQLTKAKGEKLAQTSFQLANAAYNLTVFGNSWSMSEYPFNPNWGYGYGGYDSTDYYAPYYDCSRAKKFYSDALRATKDKELAAKCCFMIAKCEQNEYFVSGEYSYEEEYKPDKYAPLHFQMFKEEYSKTAFYTDALKECSYFKEYVKHF